MIMVNIKERCTACATHAVCDDSQPNRCRKCNGTGWLKRTVTYHALARMPDAPEVLGAFQTGEPRPDKRRKAAARCA